MQNLYVSQNKKWIGNGNIRLLCNCTTYEKRDIIVTPQKTKNIPVFQETELEDVSFKNKLFLLQEPYCILLDTDKLVKEILQSYGCYKNYLGYNDKNKIIKQISLDFPRMKVHYNSVLLKNVDELFTSIQCFNKYFYESIPLFFLILVFCTQATFFYPFHILNSIYTVDYYNIYVLPLDDHPCINIVDNKDYIDIILKKSFKLIGINTAKIYHKLYVSFRITIELFQEDEDMVFHSRKCCRFKESIFYLIKV